MKTDTAYEHWEERWTTEEGRSDWSEPDRFVIDGLRLIENHAVHTVLDLGCGPGRHALYLAEHGFDVLAMDASATAVELVDKSAAARNLSVRTSIREMTDLHLDSDSLDLVLAWNVIYHGDLSIVQRSLSEITRVLRPGGLFFGTMLSMRNKEVRTGREIAHNTFINDALSDKVHPHFYCSASELINLFSGFEPLLLEDVEQKGPGSGSYHWQFIMEKK